MRDLQWFFRFIAHISVGPVSWKTSECVIWWLFEVICSHEDILFVANQLLVVNHATQRHGLYSCLCPWWPSETIYMPSALKCGIIIVGRNCSYRLSVTCDVWPWLDVKSNLWYILALLLSTMIHSILPVQITCLAIFLHNLCPCPIWCRTCLLPD